MRKNTHIHDFVDNYVSILAEDVKTSKDNDAYDLRSDADSIASGLWLLRDIALSLQLIERNMRLK